MSDGLKAIVCSLVSLVLLFGAIFVFLFFGYVIYSIADAGFSIDYGSK